MPPGPHHPQRRLEGRLGAERLDRDIDAAAVGQPHDRATGSPSRKLTVRSAPIRARHRQPSGDAVDADDRRGARELRAGGGTQADRALGEHRHAVADADAAAFRAARSRST